jgi:hypothetical protein
VILFNNQVTGLWKRKIMNDNVGIFTELFKPIPQTANNKLEVKAMKIADFLGKKNLILDEVLVK